jgi:hypothetical protein
MAAAPVATAAMAAAPIPATATAVPTRRLRTDGCDTGSGGD